MSKYFLFTLSCFFVTTLIAAPPVDLLEFKKKKKPTAPVPRAKPKQLTYGDLGTNEKKTQKVLETGIKYDVVCRESGKRDGKPVVKFRKDTKVYILKKSKNWVYVKYSPKHNPCWVPNSSVF